MVFTLGPSADGTRLRSAVPFLVPEQYEQFKIIQRHIEATQPTSDFDRFVDDVGKLEPPDSENEPDG